MIDLLLQCYCIFLSAILIIFYKKAGKLNYEIHKSLRIAWLPEKAYQYESLLIGILFVGIGLFQLLS